MRIIALVAAVAVVLAACGGDAPDTPSTVTGVVVDIRTAGAGRVESFVVKDGDRRFDIRIAAERDYGFPPDHLHQHRAAGEPVRVELERRGGDLYAVSIEDV